MRWLVALLCLCSIALAEPAPRPLPWVRITEWYITPSQARLYGPGDGTAPEPWTGAYVLSHLPETYGPQDEGVWHHVDLKPFGVGQDAKVAFLAGLLLITRGGTNEIADIRLTFRAAGDQTASCDKYLGQAIEANVGGGQRSNMASFVPLKNGEFEFCFHFNTPGQYPTNSAYGINISLQAWGR